MHKEIHNIRKTKKISSPWHLIFLRTHCVITSCNASFWHTLMNTRKSVQMKQKGKLKYTSNMRSQNEVIQVRCVEIKLKVNNNNNNNNRRRERRSAGTKPQRKSWFILSSYWSPPKLLGSVSSYQWFPPFFFFHRPFGYVINPVTLWRAVMLIKALGSPIIPVAVVLQV